MSFDVNNVNLVGGVTRDPELRTTGNGTSVVQLGVAVNHSRKIEGEWTDEPNFIDVTAFGTLADNVAESIGKGTRVAISGRLSYRTWEDKETGAKRNKLEVIAASIAPDLSRATAEITKIAREDG